MKTEPEPNSKNANTPSMVIAFFALKSTSLNPREENLIFLKLNRGTNINRKSHLASFKSPARFSQKFFSVLPRHVQITPPLRT